MILANVTDELFIAKANQSGLLYKVCKRRLYFPKKELIGLIFLMRNCVYFLIYP